jgi:hypothetical protein
LSSGYYEELEGNSFWQPYNAFDSDYSTNWGNDPDTGYWIAYNFGTTTPVTVQCVEIVQDGSEYVSEANLWVYDDPTLEYKLVTVASGLAGGLTRIQFDGSAWTSTGIEITPTAAPTEALSQLTTATTWSMDSTREIANRTSYGGFWSVYELSFYSDIGCTNKLDTSANTTNSTTTSGYYGQDWYDPTWQTYNAFDSNLTSHWGNDPDSGDDYYVGYAFTTPQAVQCVVLVQHEYEYVEQADLW